MLMAIVVGETKQRDFDAISELLKEEKLLTKSFTKYKFKRLLDRNSGCCFVAVSGKEVVGNIFATHDGAFRGSIHKLVVKKRCRRRKIASQLIGKVIKNFDSLGIDTVFTHLVKTHDPSLKLFKSLKFRVQKHHYLLDR